MSKITNITSIDNIHYINGSCSTNKYIHLDKIITPELLRKAADKMDKYNIKHIKFNGYNYSTCVEYRPETDKEKELKLKQEEQAKFIALRKLEKSKTTLINKAKKLGLILVEEGMTYDQ